MRLVDLEPKWLVVGERKVGFVFRSPTKPKCWQTCFLEAGRKLIVCNNPECYEKEGWCCEHSQLGLVEAAGVAVDDIVQGCQTDCAWTAHGELDFATLTITPSLDGSAGGLWHGFITNGEIV